MEKSNKKVIHITLLYQKRRVETTRNALCGKSQGASSITHPLWDKAPPCAEAIASTERKTNCEGVK